MAYSSWSVIYGEQPSASKWNILGTNDAFFYSYTGEGTNAIQQVKYTAYSAVATGSTTIPLDDTIPQNTEGVEYMTLAITPKSTTNKLLIEAMFFGSFAIAGGSDIVVALFQDTTANALAAVAQYMATSTGRMTIPLQHYMTAGTTSSTTFKIRAGSNNAGTTTFNGFSGGRVFSTIPKSFIKITELKA